MSCPPMKYSLSDGLRCHDAGLSTKDWTPFLSLEAADEPFGISNSKSQTANLKFAIWDFRFRASLGQGPSAAAGRLVLLERELI